jgi:hypothetical protein
MGPGQTAKLAMAPLAGEAQQIAGARIVGGEDQGVSERLKCQNTIQVEKIWNVFQKWEVGKGFSTDGGYRGGSARLTGR